MHGILRIASRKSSLAKIQAYLVGNALQKIEPELKIEYHLKESTGDKDLSSPLWKMSGKGVFTRDFREDLLSEKVDLVVHSWKDIDLDQNDETKVLSVLERVDQRDMLLFKRQFVFDSEIPNISIYSSSPRREYNLKSLLPEILPASLQKKEIIFQPVRGNIQTRLRKWQEDNDALGIVVAKAAIDRLFYTDYIQSEETEFTQLRQYLKVILKSSVFMLLPISECPNAPAQGGLAAEIKKERTEIITLVSRLTIPEVENSITRERMELKKYGGGCHQKIGVGVLPKKHGIFFSLKGITDTGTVLNQLQLEKKHHFPKAESLEHLYPLKGNNLKFNREPLNVPENIPDANLIVARGNAWPNYWKQSNYDRIIWAAGIKTWKELAKKGIWVSGCSESLGEEEEFGLDLFLKYGNEFLKITHIESENIDSQFDRYYTYKLELLNEIPDLSEKTHFFWMSGYQFDLVFQKNPSICDKHHACGPGITLSHISKQLGKGAKIDVFLNYEEWFKYHTS
ncbi:MAG: uroporphyrinogen synthase [Leptospiraceae bacterium]|nr:uroporphyrinogen synthase [Leptospiraceae bacterium]MCP5494943.1 uroporphyrinogen synthase [Leptospiraceae bacterium]